MVRSSRVGALAQALLAAEADLQRAEFAVTEFLDSLYPSSASRFGWRGWQFDRVDNAPGIQVYDVIAPSPAAVAALHRAGFVVVTIHTHDAKQFLSCACIPQIARQGAT